MIVLFPLVGFWFWASIIVSLAFLSTCVYRESYIWATLDLLLFAALFSITGHIPIIDLWHTLQAKPHLAGIWIGGYLALGVAWSTFKWFRLLSKIKGEIVKWREGMESRLRRDHQRDWAHEIEKAGKDPEKEAYPIKEADEKIRSLTDDALNDHLDHDLKHRRHIRFVDGKPKLDVGEYKTRITGWMGYWPVSAVMWFIGDFLADVFDALYALVKKLYQGMADRALS
jgi:hypothetical protein